MPVYNKHLAENYSIVVWESNETVDFLESKVFLTPEEKKCYSKMRNCNRRKEWLTVRYILQNELNIQTPIIYTQEGKPELQGKYISITHSGDYVAVMVSKYNCGIDMEKVNNKIAKVSHKVFSESEIAYATNNELLTILWCAKEAAFKFANVSSLNFIRDIHVLPFSTSYSGNLICEIRKPKLKIININYKTINNYKFVWTSFDNFLL